MSDPQEAGHSPVPAAAAPGQGTAASGPGRPRGRLPLTGNAIIQAVTEGHSAVITILAVFAALVIGGLLIVASDPVVLRAWDSFGYAPLAALSATWTSVSGAYSALFEGSIFSPATISAAFHGGSIAAIFYPLSLTAFEATPLILTGLSVAVAFRAGMFNIGAAGQWIGGALVATWLGYAVSLPIAAHAAVCVIGAFAGGAVIGWIVGEIKARTGAHFFILTIMLNYVMYNLLSFLLSSQSAMQAPGQTNQVAPNVAASATLPHVGGPPPQAGVGFLIAGGLAGLSAATIVQGQTQPLTFNSYGTYGFDGITVALLGRARPFGVVLAGLLFGALNGGGTLMEAATGVPSDVVDVIKGLIVLLVAAPPLIRLLFRLRRTGGAGPQAVAPKGWSG